MSVYLKPLLLSALLTINYACKSSLYEHQYIAHACSAIDGHRYTNSQEALEQAIASGLTYIEIDLDLTSDSILVATHGWEMYHSLVGDGDTTYAPVSYAAFKNAKYYGKYTPITYEYILKKWEECPNLILVTDKISNPEILEHFLGNLKHRMIVECFTMEDYNEIRKLGYMLPMYSGWPLTKKSLIKKRVSDLCHFRYTSLPEDYVYGGSSDDDMEKYHCRVGRMYSVFDKDRPVTFAAADSIFDKDERIRFVYVDIVN